LLGPSFVKLCLVSNSTAIPTNKVPLEVAFTYKTILHHYFLRSYLMLR